jgi:soluble lytic murein transglycosylase-like protein
VTWLILLFLVQSKDAFQSALEKQRAAAAVQRESARRQADAVAQWNGSTAAQEGAAECDPIPDPYASVILGYAAGAHHIDPKLLRNVILKESGFRPCAVSAKGAQGLMQLMPATIDQLHVADPFDPKQNVDAGARYLNQLLERYKGDIALALAAYNAGPSSVDKAGGIPDIKETRDYVEAITSALGASPTPRSPPPIPPPKPIEN